MSDSGRIEDVSDTSFWVAFYRARESERPDALFHDDLARKLIGQRGERIAATMAQGSQYTEWSVIARTVLIDRFVEQLVADGVDAVLNLGAGLDTRPYRMNLPARLHWIEVDYPNIVAHKNALLATETPRCKLTRVELDLADAAQRQAFLASVLLEAKRILVLTEGVILYMTPEHVAQLAAELREQPRFAHWITEYFDARIYKHLQRPARVAQMKRAPFLFFPPDWFAFFRAVGWKERETRYSGEIAVEFRRPPPMPRWARLLLRFVPARAKAQSLRVAGYTVLEPERS
jgi:methyltransferase (TIGR00027 family)